MNESYPLVTGGEVSKHVFAEFEYSEPVFLLQNNKHLHIKEVNSYMLNFLTASILRTPKDLLIHLQRITLCYEQKDEDQLYAAIVDFFVVLQGAGLSIRQRVVDGSRNHLSPLLRQRLKNYLSNYHLIQGNIYSVLTSGLESNVELVVSQTEDKGELDHDPLKIARDFIEYSQLGEAKKMLETSILASPDYIELHEDLLELYKSTNDIDAFHEMKVALIEINHPMQTQWDALNSYFTQ
ncbi:MAG: hypothetical protein GQ529_13140 [Methyloprofundus sp.]|nr:hypothetical protein [Methyloprofundus sp.]